MRCGRRRRPEVHFHESLGKWVQLEEENSESRENRLWIFGGMAARRWFCGPGFAAKDGRLGELGRLARRWLAHYSPRLFRDRIAPANHSWRKLPRRVRRLKSEGGFFSSNRSSRCSSLSSNASTTSYGSKNSQPFLDEELKSSAPYLYGKVDALGDTSMASDHVMHLRGVTESQHLPKRELTTGGALKPPPMLA